MNKYFLIKPEKDRISQGIDKNGLFVDLRNGETLLYFDTQQEAIAYIKTNFPRYFKQDRLRLISGEWELCHLQPRPIRTEKIIYSFPMHSSNEDIANELVKKFSREFLVYGTHVLYTLRKLHSLQTELPEGYYHGYYVLNEQS